MNLSTKIILAAAAGIGALLLINRNAGASESPRSRRIAALRSGEATATATATATRSDKYCPITPRKADFRVDMSWGLKDSVRTKMIADIRAITTQLELLGDERLWFELHGSRANAIAIAIAIENAFQRTVAVDVMYPGESQTEVNGWIEIDTGSPEITEFEVHCG